MKLSTQHTLDRLVALISLDICDAVVDEREEAVVLEVVVVGVCRPCRIGPMSSSPNKVTVLTKSPTDLSDPNPVAIVGCSNVTHILGMMLVHTYVATDAMEGIRCRSEMDEDGDDDNDDERSMLQRAWEYNGMSTP